jgi:hypothetical protein
VIGYSPPQVSVPRPGRIIWSTMSLEGPGTELTCIAGGAVLASAQWPVANTAIFVPFQVAEPVTVVKLWVRNGTTISAGNIDMGIYLADGTKVVSQGSTPSATADLLQELNITDTVLATGNYYLALNSDTAASTQTFYFHNHATAIAGWWAAAGCYQQAVGAVTLPSPATFAAFGQVRVPWMGWSARSMVQ